MYNIKNYTLESIFNWGKNVGNTFENVAKNEPNYIEWCAIHLKSFYFNYEIIRTELEEKNISFDISEEAIYSLKNKYKNYSNTESNHSYNNSYSRYGGTYSEFTGSYAQDCMGYDDETINDAFEGDPDAYWNID